MTLLQSGITKSLAVSYDIDNSLRFNDADSPSLTRTPTSSGNRDTWTWSCWVKGTGYGKIFGAGTSYQSSNAYATYIRYDSDDTLRVRQEVGGGSTNWDFVTSQVFRDPSAWYHFLVAVDTTQGTEADRFKLYVNGTQVTSFSTSSYPTQDQDTYINHTNIHVVGHGSDESVNGYLADELSSTTNQWIPKDASGLTFGTNGFYQKYGATELANSFADSADHVIHTMTANGDANTDTAEKKFGTASLECTGTDGADNLSTPNSDDFMFGTGDLTVEFWVYTTNSGVHQYMWGQIRADGTDEFYMRINTDGKILFLLKGESSPKQCISGSAMSISAWHHIAGVRDGDNLRLYIDGVLEDTEAFTSQSQMAPTTVFEVGATPYNSDGGHSGFSGYIDEFRLSNTCRYPSGTTFTPSTTAFTADKYTKLLLHMDGVDGATSFPDSSWTGAPRHTITANGDVTNTRAVRKIGDSSIKFDGTDDELTVSSTVGNFGSGDFTVECWVNGNADANVAMVCGQIRTDGTDELFVRRDITNEIRTILLTDAASYNIVGTTATSNGTWYHVAVTRDGSTWRLYVDGTQENSVSISGSVTNPTSVFGIGSGGDFTSNHFDGYLDEFRVSDTCRYPDGTTFTTFGQGGGTIANPTAFTTDANTKLLIHSNWDGGLGADSSGNYNTFTATNLVATDQVLDSPTNNFATLNPVSPRNNGSTWVGTWAEGNLDYLNSSGALSGVSTSTMATDSTNKFYYEFYVKVSTSGDCGIGQCGADVDSRLLGGPGGSEGSPFYTWATQAGNYFVSGVSTSAGVTAATDDIVQIAYDASSGKIWYGKNNTWNGSGDPANGTNAAQTLSGGGSMVPLVSGYNGDRFVVNFGQDSSFAGNKTSGSAAAQDANEVGDFYYAPPTDFLALCADNISAPEIALPGKNFNTILYDDGAGAKTGVGFQPDLVWVKSRGSAYEHELTDAVRGVTKALSSDSTNTETTDSTGLTAFGADGFTVGADTNYSDTTGSGMVAWNWKANGSGSTNTDGTISSTVTVSANTTSGFSIVKYLGTPDSHTSGATVGHGLSQAPELVIVKDLDAGGSWFVGSDYTDTSSPWDYKLRLNSDDAKVDATTWNDTAPTASVFSIGAVNVAANGTNYIAYCFHSVEGYSKVGSYEGNGNADGPFIYTGFEPAYVMIKRYDAAGGWRLTDNVRDPYNFVYHRLYADTNAAEYTSDTAHMTDHVSNGFKVRDTNTVFNASSGDYLYLAFAESPFKTSNAR